MCVKNAKYCPFSNILNNDDIFVLNMSKRVYVNRHLE